MPGTLRPRRRRRGAGGWRRLATAAVLALAVAAGACRPVDPSEDTRIEAEIKARLVAEKFANLTRLGVVSRRGIVYLSGTVASLDERARAEALASGVRGVGRVVNTLAVQPE
jgi:osmotically-inducible protein OsmY